MMCKSGLKSIQKLDIYIHIFFTNFLGHFSGWGSIKTTHPFQGFPSLKILLLVNTIVKDADSSDQKSFQPLFNNSIEVDLKIGIMKSSRLRIFFSECRNSWKKIRFGTHMCVRLSAHTFLSFIVRQFIFCESVSGEQIYINPNKYI
jgi:hypothetical protein